MDIDFITDLSSDFKISLSDNPQGVSGNRALVNRFEITFFTKNRQFLFNDEDIVVDEYGGDAEKLINKPRVLNNVQSIAAAMDIVVSQTVKSMKNNEPSNIPSTEKIDSAKVIGINIISDTVYGTVQIFPVETESYEDILFNLPIIRRT